MTAFVALNNRSGQRRQGGSGLTAANAWCTTYFGRDALHLAQTLTIRFTAASLILRMIAGDRLLLRERVYLAGVLIATIAARIDPTENRSHLSWAMVNPAIRGRGSLRHLLQNLLLVMRDCGSMRVSLVAGLTHGGYVWAAYGFLPESPAEWARVAGVLRRKFAAISPQLTPLHTSAIDKLLSSPDRLALRAIAAITTPVAGTTLGKYLLMGTEWRGELDFSDEASALIYLRRIGLIS